MARRQNDHRTDAAAPELDLKPDFQRRLVAFSHDFDNRLVTYLCWYLLTSVGMVVCRSLIRFGAGWLRNRGYNRRFVAVAGDLPVGQVLLDSFRKEPWLGFEVVGFITTRRPAAYHLTGRAATNS